MAITITATTLNESGYLVGTHISQPLIDRCLKDVLTAYILPILPEYEDDDSDVLDTVKCIVYILLCKRNVVKTRFGAKEKQDTNSTNVSEKEINTLTVTADMYLESLRKKVGAVSDAAINDIALIYNFNSLL